MCKVLGIRRSTYYKRINHVPSNHELENKVLDEEILTIYSNSKKRYGAPKIQKELVNTKASLKRVQRRMVILGIHSVAIKKYRHYPSKQVSDLYRENILEQDFEADTINQKLCTDITYIHTQQDGWTYLASVMDLYSRKIIGWSFAKTMTSDLAIQAVKNACLNIANTEGIIIHSDLGTQYTSDNFEEYINSLGMMHSFSRKGCPYDNACIESFHSVLKKEEVNRRCYRDFNEAYNAVFEYIESWYNRKRIHSSLDYKTPDAVHKAAGAA